MYRLEKEGTASTPYVLIDEEMGYIKIVGESYNENVIEFYRDVTEWLERFLKTDFTRLTFDCVMGYFNSSTAKLLMNMLAAMDNSCTKSKRVVVNWITTHDNEIVIECGEDFKEEMLNLEFNIIAH